MAFSAPVHPTATLDGRATFAQRPVAPPKSSLSLRHSRTASLTSPAPASTTDKKLSVAAILEAQLLRDLGGSDAVNALIKREVQGAVLGGQRLTPEVMRGVRDRVAALALRDST
jgi:hypothetical protein